MFPRPFGRGNTVWVFSPSLAACIFLPVALILLADQPDSGYNTIVNTDKLKDQGGIYFEICTDAI